MKRSVVTFYSAVVSILVTRVILGLIWDLPQMVAAKTDFWHHAYTGLFLFGVGTLFGRGYNKYVIQGIGLGLMIDQATVVFKLLGKSETDYWSIWCWGTSLVILAMWWFVIKNKLSFAIRS